MQGLSGDELGVILSMLHTPDINNLLCCSTLFGNLWALCYKAFVRRELFTITDAVPETLFAPDTLARILLNNKCICGCITEFVSFEAGRRVCDLCFYMLQLRAETMWSITGSRFYYALPCYITTATELERALTNDVHGQTLCITQDIAVRGVHRVTKPTKITSNGARLDIATLMFFRPAVLDGLHIVSNAVTRSDSDNSIEALKVCMTVGVYGSLPSGTVYIRNCEIEGRSGAGLLLHSGYLHITNTRVHTCTRAGVCVLNGCEPVISGCTFQRIAGVAIEMYDSNRKAKETDKYLRINTIK